MCNALRLYFRREVIGRPHGEPPFPVREDSLLLKKHIMPERSIVIVFAIFCHYSAGERGSPIHKTKIAPVPYRASDAIPLSNYLLERTAVCHRRPKFSIFNFPFSIR